MKLLLTNIWLHHYGGTEVYVRDLAFAMIKQNIHVEIYSPFLGDLAEEIRNAGIHIVDDVDQLIEIPDLIHAQHYIPTVEVISRFPAVPVVYSLHDRTNPVDFPPKYSRIIRYYAVDYNCLDRLVLDNGIDKSKTEVVYNWVNTDKYKLRKISNERPIKALVFSNYATKSNYYKEVKAACKHLGIQLDGIGGGLNNPQKNPQDFLPAYDIVFAKAKAAMEAMSTGAAVILCDFMGLGGMVTSENFDHFRKFNFGMKVLSRQATRDLIINEIECYDPEDAMKVARKIREEASYKKTSGYIIESYKQIIENQKNEPTQITDLDQKLIDDYTYLKNHLKTNHLKELHADPESVINQVKKEVSDLNKTITLLNREIENKVKQLKDCSQELSLKDQVITNLNNQFVLLVNSFSFKIGRFITFIPRFIKKLLSKKT